MDAEEIKNRIKNEDYDIVKIKNVSLDKVRDSFKYYVSQNHHKYDNLVKGAKVTDRDLVNHIRHHFTNYDSTDDKFMNCPDEDLRMEYAMSLKPKLKKMVLNTIAMTYPELTRECKEQLIRSGLARKNDFRNDKILSNIYN